MSIKLFFASLLVVLIGFTVVARLIEPRPADPNKVMLTWVSDDNPVREGQMALFDRLHPRYELKLDPSNGGMEKVIVQSLAGVGPDLFDCYDGFQLSAYVRSGVAWDVTDQLRSDGIDVHKMIWPALTPIITRDGRVYGFPTNVAANGILFNKTIFDQEHVPYPKGPWTWQQFLPLAQRMTHRDASGRATRFGLVLDWSNNWLQFVLQWGGQLYSPDGTRCTLDSPQAIAGVQFLHDLIYRYHVMPSPSEEAMATQGGWGSFAISAFGAGESAMALGGRWWLCTLRDPKNYPDLRIGFAESPYGVVRVFRGYGRATLINRASPHRQQALQFLEYLASNPYNALVNHQGDGMGPVIAAAYTPQFLHDPAYPQEDSNEVWRDEMIHAVPDQVSPFVNGEVVNRILTKQMDLIKADQKPVADALRTATEQINQEIQRTIQRDPTLRARYEKLVREMRD